MINVLPDKGFVRLHQIIGDKKSCHTTPPIIPMSHSAWWAGVSSGKYPKPVKLGRISLWRVEDIVNLINKIGDKNG